LKIQAKDTVNSPCINICTLDARERFCLGCFRTLAEIAAWSAASNAERLRIVEAATRRREAAAAGEAPNAVN